ncbi:hypothetical protein [Amycolatopsis minnesotensis]|uniref:Saccharopine dehydrogenase NADP-binding domain-containing protein n=1 Tax=Amycolatopsis minnesotensis TaxID=337894 RepID=A0ABP5C9K3_9PSEU
MIAVLGASGAVGRGVLAALRSRGIPVRGGSRSSGVDLFDDHSLATFVDGARLVVNCAGPSHGVARRVALAAMRAGADHVDAGGDGVRVTPAPGRAAVFAAGAAPGLSGVLPRALARRFDEVRSLVSYSGVRDRFTTAGAEDFLHGGSEAGAGWRRGQRVSSAVSRVDDLTLPRLPLPVVALPFFDEESASVARALSLVDATRYAFFEDGRLLAALGRVRGQRVDDAVRSLREAAALDTAGRATHATLLVQLDGTSDGAVVTRTAIARAGSTAVMTAAVTVATALAVLAGEVAEGTYQAAEVLDPASASELDGVEIVVEDRPIADLALAEEGTL